MSKQTAVEWLQERLLLSLSDELKSLNGFFVIAKEMEKEQITEAHGNERDYLSDSGNFITISAEQYYNETYKKDK
jgi:hypothetical protein